MSRQGRCLCGAVQYTADEVDTNVHGCHCTMCQRWAGGPALAVSVGSVTFEGAEHITRYASSEWAERGFCSVCGSNLYYLLTAADQYLIQMGTFDDPAALTVTGEIFIDEKPAGYALAGDHSRLTGDEFLASQSPS